MAVWFRLTNENDQDYDGQLNNNVLRRALWNLYHNFICFFASFACVSWRDQSTGGFIAITRYASATPLPPSILSRGVGWKVTTDSLSHLRSDYK